MSNEGGVSALLFHCVFNGDESVTHYMDDVEPGLRDALPNLYIVCVADNERKPRRVVGAFVAKTTFHHNDAGFEKAMFGLLGSKPQLQSLVSKKTSLLPAKLNVPPGPPLSEDEMLRLAFQQYMKFSASGTA